ncbi:MAG TPA: branched-chain amino acid ABC transporter substrate-binding protein [Gemmataceae bacterium]|nr:branched-chain amino acid ABC transporter substrate-binding protein [Gemmataceae bacterium]
MDRRRFLKSTTKMLAGGTLVGLAGCGGCNSDKNVIRIISSFPRTGSAKGQTDTMVDGIRLAIDDYGGQIGEFKIDYLDKDDATAAAGQWDGPSEGANARMAAADPAVMVYIGPYNSGAAKISMPILNDAPLLQISPAATWPGLTKNVPGGDPSEPDCYRPAKKITFCRVCPTDDTQGPLSAEFAAATGKDGLGVKSVYVLDDKELYGAGIAGLFKKKWEEMKLEVLGHDSIVTTQTDFKQLAQKVAGTNPGMVYFGGTTQTKAGQLIKDLRAAGVKVPVMVPDGCYEMAFIKSAEAADLVNVYATIGGTDPSMLTEGKGAEFVKRYKDKYQKDPEAYAIYGYEAAKVFLEAVKKVGQKDRAAILEACLATKDFDQGAVGKWSFDANGDTTLQQLTISKIEGGKFKPVSIKTLSKK